MKKIKLFDYDDSSIESIINYSEGLKNRTFDDVIKEYNSYIESTENEHNNLLKKYTFNPSSKGGLGNLIEQCYFGLDPNPKQEADFAKCDLELKVTPIDKNKNNQQKAGERLSITNISFSEPIEDDFYKSHVWDKIRNILIISYLRDKNLKGNDRVNNLIKYIYLYKPSKEDLAIIIDDFNQICRKIKLGLGHELHEGDTTYLGACTKGSSSKDEIEQFYGSHIKAKRRNFCFKQPYMNYVLKNYIIPSNKKEIDEKIFKADDLLIDSFEEAILSKVNRFKGKSDKELADLYNIKYKNNKALWNTIAFRMLGIKSNRAEEFEKAGIKLKTIRIEENNNIKENWELPAFEFIELNNETDWESSELRDYLFNTKFFIVFFKKIGDKYYVDKAKFWHVDEEYLDSVVKCEWEENKKIIKEGIKFEIKGSRVLNNLPNSSETEFLHIRPHAAKSAYKLNNDFTKGNIERDGDLLPNGEIMTKSSFWINKTYFKKLY